MRVGLVVMFYLSSMSSGRRGPSPVGERRALSVSPTGRRPVGAGPWATGLSAAKARMANPVAICPRTETCTSLIIAKEGQAPSQAPSILFFFTNHLCGLRAQYQITIRFVINAWPAQYHFAHGPVPTPHSILIGVPPWLPYFSPHSHTLLQLRLYHFQPQPRRICQVEDALHRPGRLGEDHILLAA